MKKPNAYRYSLFALLMVSFSLTACDGFSGSRFYVDSDPEVEAEEVSLIDDESMLKKCTLTTNITYKSVMGTPLHLDLYTPNEMVYESTPVCLFFHSGSWMRGGKIDAQYDSNASTMGVLLDLGYSIVSVDYRLCNGSSNLFPMNIADCKDAVRWVRKNAETYHFDTNNIGAWGLSAGAHLALLCGYTDNTAFPGDTTLSTYSSEIDWVLDFFGPTDIYSYTEHFTTSYISEYLNSLFGISDYTSDISTERLAEIKTLVDSYSPLYYVKSTCVPTLIMQGSMDPLVFPSVTETFVAALKNVGAKYKFLLYEGVGHWVPNVITDADLHRNLIKNVKHFLKNI